jgi:hypothetical protein
MAAFTNIAENKLIDWFFRGQALGLNGASAGSASGPTTLYVSLFTGAPSDSAAGTEVAGGSYARVAINSTLSNWAGTQGAGTTVASNGTSGITSNNNAITFPAPTASWGVATYAGIHDLPTGGNLIAYSALSIPKTINNGDPAPSFLAGTLTFQLDN